MFPFVERRRDHDKSWENRNAVRTFRKTVVFPLRNGVGQQAGSAAPGAFYTAVPSARAIWYDPVPESGTNELGSSHRYSHLPHSLHGSAGSRIVSLLSASGKHKGGDVSSMTDSCPNVKETLIKLLQPTVAGLRHSTCTDVKLDGMARFW